MNEKQRPATTNAWIIWAAMIVSIGLYGFVVVWLRMQGTEPPPDPDPMLGLILPVATLAPAAGSLAVGRLVKLGNGHPLTTWILRWAMAESVAVFGFVMLFLGVNDLVGAGLLGAGALLILVQPPSARELEAFRGP